MIVLPIILLNYMNISYTRIGGEAWEKIHPSTYFCIFALLIAIFSRADPIKFIGVLCRHEPRIMSYFFGVLLIMLITVVSAGVSELGFLLDTLLTPAAVAIVLIITPVRTRETIFKAILALIIANALIGIAEVALHEQFIPPTNADGSPFIDAQFRPWAFLGHPLNNALITSSVLLIAYSAIQSLTKRFVIVLLLLASLLAFGGRTAFIGSIAALSLLLVGEFAVTTARGRFTPARGIFALLLMMGAPAALALLFIGTNIGDRIVENLAWDSSANTRVEAYQLLQMLSGSDLWFGIGSQRLAAMSARIGYEGIIIENFWLAMLARLGLIQFVGFAVFFLLFLSRLCRATPAGTRIGVVFFLIVASTNNSLSTKNSALSLLTAMALCSPAMLIAHARYGISRHARFTHRPPALRKSLKAMARATTTQTQSADPHR